MPRRPPTPCPATTASPGRQAARWLAGRRQAEGATSPGAQAPTEVHLVGHSAGSIFLAACSNGSSGEDPGRVADLPGGRGPDGHVDRAGAAASQGRCRREVRLVRAEPRPRARRRVRRPQGSRSTTSRCSTSSRRRSRNHATPRRRRSPWSGWPTSPRPRSRAPVRRRGARDRRQPGVVPNATPPQSRSDAAAHGAFDDDIATMTSVLLRILGQDTVQPGNEFVPNLAAPDLRCAHRVAADGARRTSHPRSCSPRSAARGPPRPAGRCVPAQALTASAARRGGAAQRGPGSRVMAAMERDGWTRS